MASVVHFEIHASDPAKAIAFYEALFGWTFRQWESHPYWLIETDPNYGPKAQNGGLLARRGPPPADGQPVNAFVCTIDVADLDNSLVQVRDLGGAVAVVKAPVKGIGWVAYAKDPDGNIFGMLQADKSAA